MNFESVKRSHYVCREGLKITTLIKKEKIDELATKNLSRIVAYSA
jgi:hypothetical protein